MRLWRIRCANAAIGGADTPRHNIIISDMRDSSFILRRDGYRQAVGFRKIRLRALRFCLQAVRRFIFLAHPVSPHDAVVCVATSCCGNRGLSENMTALARDIGEARAVCAQAPIP